MLAARFRASMQRDVGRRPSIPNRPSHCQYWAWVVNGVASSMSACTRSRLPVASGTGPAVASTTAVCVASATASGPSPGVATAQASAARTLFISAHSHSLSRWRTASRQMSRMARAWRRCQISRSPAASSSANANSRMDSSMR